MSLPHRDRRPRVLGGLLLLLLAAGPVAAQAWTQPAGQAYVKLSQGHSTAAEHYTSTGLIESYARTHDGTAFYDRGQYLYAEAGLTGQLTLVALVGYKTLTVDDAVEQTTQGLAMVRVGLRHDLRRSLGLLDTRHAAAVNVALTLPTGYARNAAPALGTGQADAEAVLAYGLSLYPLPAYAQAALGYRARTSRYGLSRALACEDPTRDSACMADLRPDIGDEWLIGAEAGASFGRWALVHALVQGVWSNASPEVDFDPMNPIPTRTRYLKLGFGATIYPVRQLGLSVQRFQTPFGRNTIRSTDWFFGLEYRLG